MCGFGRAMGVGLLAVSAVSCGGTVTAPGDVPYGERFDLKVGASRRVGDDGLRVAFQSVKSDSRCPIDAICIDAGNAVAAFTFTVDDRTLSRDVHTNPPQNRVSLDRYSVQLLELQPYPRSDRPTPPAEYVAQVRVDRR